MMYRSICPSNTIGRILFSHYCLKDVKSWMDVNFLNLNEYKTEIIMFGCKYPVDFLVTFTPNIRSFVKKKNNNNKNNKNNNLGMTFGSVFKLNKQVSSVIQTSFYQLRLIAKVKSYLSPKYLEKVIHAFITARLHYCSCTLCWY